MPNDDDRPAPVRNGSRDGGGVRLGARARIACGEVDSDGRCAPPLELGTQDVPAPRAVISAMDEDEARAVAHAVTSMTRLVADRAVDTLTQEVGVAIVPQVLLDHVDGRPTQLRRTTGAAVASGAVDGYRTKRCINVTATNPKD